VTAGVADKVMGLMTKQVTVENDEGIRAGTTNRRHHGLRSALPGGLVSAGNASQFSDGAGACVLMDETLAKSGLQAAGPFPGLCRGRLRARRNGHRPRVCHSQGAVSAWA
jgi:acetyl-CoA C-acetyltransferase